jgi:hypothetical protein
MAAPSANLQTQVRKHLAIQTPDELPDWILHALPIADQREDVID